ncbi:MAG: GTPase [Deferribacteres bacterium]|jgi:GTP-binding protein|nr:GTPase [Deferribacteres bacterium]
MFTVGILGRPNVGKSTLFNRFAGRRIAITDDMPGVTRDRLEYVCEWGLRKFKLYDTAGFDLREDILKKEMQEQFYRAIDEVDLCLLMVDAKEGLHPLDEIVADLLRKKGKDTILVLNKVDNPELEMAINEFYKLGFEKIFAVSATHGRNVDELLDEITSRITEEEEAEVETDRIKLAVIGKPNVGKSSLINAWLNEERVIVTEIPGTTRDSVNVNFEFNGKKYTLIDTAGIRKKSVMFKDKIEKYGYFRGQDAIAESDICIAVIDATQGILDRDIKVIADANRQYRPVILVFNKWDLIENPGEYSRQLGRDVKDKLKFLYNPQIVFVSAQTGKNVYKIFKSVEIIDKEYSKRVQTSKLNEVLQLAQQMHQPPVVKNKRLKFFYMTQVGTKPPEFVVFVNYPEAVHFSYERFILNLIRQEFGFDGVPLKINFRQKGDRSTD